MPHRTVSTCLMGLFWALAEIDSEFSGVRNKNRGYPHGQPLTMLLFKFSVYDWKMFCSHEWNAWKNELFYLYTNIAISCDYSYFWGFFFSLKKNALSVYDRMLQIGTGLRQELGKVWIPLLVFSFPYRLLTWTGSWIIVPTWWMRNRGQIALIDYVT